MNVPSLHTISHLRNPGDFSRFTGVRKDLGNKSQKFIVRLNYAISLEYFSVVIYFYSRKTREIRSLLSYLSPWFYIFSICLACSGNFSLSPPCSVPESAETPSFSNQPLC